MSRYRIPATERVGFLADLEEALAVLARQAGCIAASVGQATDDADLVLVRTEWTGIGAYRRALSAFDVKVTAIPVLSRAIDEPSAFETIRRWDDGHFVVSASGLAADAQQVRLGDAAAANVRPVST